MGCDGTWGWGGQVTQVHAVVTTLLRYPSQQPFPSLISQRLSTRNRIPLPLLDGPNVIVVALDDWTPAIAHAVAAVTIVFYPVRKPTLKTNTTITDDSIRSLRLQSHRENGLGLCNENLGTVILGAQCMIILLALQVLERVRAFPVNYAIIVLIAAQLDTVLQP